MIEDKFQRPRLQQAQAYFSEERKQRACHEQAVLPDMRPKVEQDPPKAGQAFLERCCLHLMYNVLSRINTRKAEDMFDGRIPRVITNHLGASGLPEAQAQVRLTFYSFQRTGQRGNISWRDMQTSDFRFD